MEELISKHYKEYSEKYLANEFEVLNDRSIWKGLNNDRFPQPDISIFNFIKSESFVNPFKNLHINTLKDIYYPIHYSAENYAEWCISKHRFGKKMINEIKSSLNNHFKGYFGERFAYHFLNNREIRIVNYEGNTHIRVRFSYMIPYCKQTIGFGDYGGDFLAMCEYNGKLYPCIIQSKFHNPNNVQKPSSNNMVITQEYMSSIFGQGCGCCWVNQFCKDPCVFALYTGAEQFVGKRIFDHENTNSKRFAIINHESIDKTFADKTFGGVVESLYEEVENIKIAKN